MPYYIILKEESKLYPKLCSNNLAIGGEKLEEDSFFDNLDWANKELNELKEKFSDVKYRLFKLKEI